MRHKPAGREPRAALPPEEPLAPSGPRFEGTPAGFAMRWVGATLGAVFLAWIAQTFLFSALFSAAYQSAGTFGIRVIHVVLSTFVYGGAIAGFQQRALRRSLEGRRIRWLQATLAGYFVGGLVGLLLPETSWTDSSLPKMLFWGAGHGVLTGGAIGVAQALALQKGGLGDWILRWTLASVGVNIFGNIAGMTLWKVLAPAPDSGMLSHVRLYALLSFVHSMVIALVTALPLGLVLGGCLYRRFGSPSEASR